MEYKSCTKCVKTLPSTEYNIHHKRKDGSIAYRAKCKKCTYKVVKKKRDSQRTTPKQRYNKPDKINNVKICSKCGINKSLDNYNYISKRNVYQPQCNDCQYKYDRDRMLTQCYKEKSKIRSQTVKNKYTHYKTKAKNRKKDFQLTVEEFEFLTRNKKCYLCNNYYKKLGIDRVKNHIGYIKLNCQSCCQKCNIMKWDLPLDDMYNHMKIILKNRPKFL